LAGLFPAGIATRVCDAHLWAHPGRADERQLIAHAVAKRRREFMAGRNAAHALLESLGVAHRGPIGIDEKRLPQWPEGVIGSISHSGGCCLAVLARGDDFALLGVDVESISPLAPALINRILGPAEQQQLAAIEGREIAGWAKIVFSIKEALFKACFGKARIFFGFRQAQIILHPQDNTFEALLDSELAIQMSLPRVYLGHFATDENYVYAGLATSIPKNLG